MIRVTLTPEQRAERNERARVRPLAPRLRDRLEMVRLSDRGQTIPQIARRLGVHEQTVRTYLTAFRAHGFAALPDRPVPGRPPTVTPADVAALGHVLDAAAAQGRTWTTPHLRHWLATERGGPSSTGRRGVVLRRARLRWQRTKRAGRHLQQDPALQDAANAHLASLLL